MRITGFRDADITLFDLTDPARPLLVPAQVSVTGPTYTVAAVLAVATAPATADSWQRLMQRTP